MSRHPDETQLAAFVMGELTGESERSQAPLEAPVQGHLRTCAQCQAAVARLQEVMAVSDHVAGKAVTQEELSKAHEALLERLRREMIPADRPARRRFRPRLRWLAPSLAAAAVCVALVVLVIPRSTAQVALADIQRALEQVPWVRFTGHLRRLRAGQTSPEEQEAEIWYGFNPMREAQRAKDGGVSFSDASKKRTYRYDPKTDTVTIRYRSERHYDQVGSPMEGFTWILGIAPLVDWTLIGQVREEREGRSVEVLTFERADETKTYVPGVDKQRFVVVCDSSTRLPIEVSTIGWKGGQVIFEASGTVDYPAAGPTSIYDLGAPRTAKVDNYLPEADVMALQDRIDAHLERFGPVYDAVLYARHVSGIAKNPPSDESYIFRVRQDHGRLRLDVYDLFAPGEDPASETPSPDDLAAIKAWMTPERFYWTLLVGEEWVHRLGGWGRSRRGKLIKVPRNFQYRKGENFLTGLMWPHRARVRTRGLRLRSLEAGDGGLPCLERGGHRLFINPERDYIVERYEREQGRNSVWVRTVQEYAQTEVGYWYPTVVQEQWHITTEAGERQPQGPEGFYYIHLETPDSIPDEVFDPESLGPTTEE